MKSMRALLPILMLGSSACATVAGVRRQPLDRGMLTYYPRPAEATIEAACRALQGERATLKGVDRRDSATVVLGTKGGSFLGSGEIVRVVITSPSLDTSAVRVVSRTNFTPMANPTAALFGFDRGVAVAARMDRLLGGPALGAGIRVRAWRADSSAVPVMGTVAGGPRDTLVLEQGTAGPRVAIPLTQVRRMDFQRGWRNRAGPGIVLGAVTGVVAGGLIGRQWGEKDCAAVVGPCIDRGTTGILAAVAFGAVGTVVGGMVGRAIKLDRWVPAPWPPVVAVSLP
jgi:hypothetical protein